LPKTPPGGFVVRDNVGQQFESNFALQVLVAGAVHDPHAALADPLEKAVMTKDLTECWFRRHFSRLGGKGR
jgi:hypothetical protein